MSVVTLILLIIAIWIGLSLLFTAAWAICGYFHQRGKGMGR